MTILVFSMTCLHYYEVEMLHVSEIENEYKELVL